MPELNAQHREPVTTMHLCQDGLRKPTSKSECPTCQPAGEPKSSRLREVTYECGCTASGDCIAVHCPMCGDPIAKDAAEPAPGEGLTIREAQTRQPWTVPYSSEVVNSGVPHILGSHCALHAAKTVGKIAAVFESLDHSGGQAYPEQVAVLADMSADLVTAALRFANLYGFDLEHALRRRVKEKNGVEYPHQPAAEPAWGVPPDPDDDFTPDTDEPRTAEQMAEDVRLMLNAKALAAENAFFVEQTNIALARAGQFENELHEAHQKLAASEHANEGLRKHLAEYATLKGAGCVCCEICGCSTTGKALLYHADNCPLSPTTEKP